MKVKKSYDKFDIILRKKKLEEALTRNNNEENVFFVTDLVMQCPYRLFLSKQLKLYNFNINHKILLGDFIHAGIQSFLTEYQKEVPIEAKVNSKSILNKAKELNLQLFEPIQQVLTKYDEIVIKGRMDLVNDEEIVELKFINKNDIDYPLTHHILQVKYYYVMNLLNGKDLKTRIVYITQNLIKEFEIEFEVENPMEELINMVLNSFVFENKEKWVCNYCKFNDFCSFKN